MALLRNAEGKDSSGGYARLFGDDAVGQLLSRVQGTVISAGNELEKIIKSRVKSTGDLDQFLKEEIMPDGVFVADKKLLKKCQTLQSAGAEPDFVIFKRRNNKQKCHIVELKDGHAFDTKKAAAEHRSMHAFINQNAAQLQYTIEAHFCGFNKDTRDEIFQGYKRKIPIKEAMTGREFCELLEIDYDEIVAERARHGPENLQYFLAELLKIKTVKKLLIKMIKQ